MLVPEVIFEANRIRKINADKLSELIAELNRVSDEAYYEYEKYRDIDWPYAVRAGRIMDKAWTIRVRIGKYILREDYK